MLPTIMKLSQHTQMKTKCANCGKTIAPAGAGSLTAWLFRQAECRCESEPRPEDQPNDEADSTLLPDDSGNTAYAHKSGELIGESYEVIEALGRGGMGEVYSVVDRRTETVFALKIIAPGLGEQKILAKRLEHEAEAAKSLSHANIASVYDVGRDKSGAPFLIMDYIVGENLEQLLRSEVFLQSQRALELFTQVAEALVHAHSKGIVHRDLKPSNILLAKSDSGHELVKLVDFGIAKLTDAHSADKTKLTQTGDLIGSPLYMSPEQCRGDELDGRSDIYSFGCIMYEAVSGKPPFSGDNPVRILLKHVSEPAPHLSNNVRISQSFKAVIERCLEKLPENRYASAAALFQDLKNVSDGKQLPWTRRLRMAPHRKRILIALSGIILLIAVAGSSTYLKQTNPIAEELSHGYLMSLASLPQPGEGFRGERPDFFTMHRWGMIHFQHGHYDRAVQLIDLCERADPSVGAPDPYRVNAFCNYSPENAKFRPDWQKFAPYLADDLTTMGYCYAKLKQADAAAYYYQSALRLFEKFGNGEQTGTAVHGYAELLRQRQKADAADALEAEFGAGGHIKSVPTIETAWTPSRI